MWTRKELKKRAKLTMKHSYWRIVGVILIVAFISGNLNLNIEVSSHDEIPEENQGNTDVEKPDIGGHWDVKSNSQIVDEIVSAWQENNGERKILEEAGKEIRPTRGVLAGVFNSVTSTKSFLFGFLNAVNQFVFQDKVAAGLIILAGACLMLLFWFFVQNVIYVGKCRFFLESRGYTETSVGKLCFPWHMRRTVKTAVTMFFKSLYTMLWSLTIIGGIIKSYSYMMIPFILAENPDISRKDAFELSKKMMRGEKWNAVKLDLSFVGWQLLSCFTLGVLDWLFIYPYRETAYTELYMTLRSKAKQGNFPGAALLADNALEAQLTENVYPEEAYLIQPVHRMHIKTLDYHRHYSIWSLVMLFFTFSMIGWIWEVSLHLFTTGEFVNRGTLFGPWLPIYGTGGILVLILLKRFADKPALTYLLTVAVCGIVEYSSAWYLWETKHMKWWDYTGYFANIQGRVCLEGLIVFGIGGCAFVYLLAPFFDELYKKIPKRIVITVCCVLLTLFCADQIYCSKHPNAGKGITDTVCAYNVQSCLEIYADSSQKHWKYVEN